MSIKPPSELPRATQLVAAAHDPDRFMIIEGSDQVPGATLFKRFPVPRNMGVAPESRIKKGKTWPAPAGATCTK
jgi:hypothetical protein